MKLTSGESKQVVALYYANRKSPTRTFRQFTTWAANNGIAARASKKNVTDTMKRFETRVDIEKVKKQKVSMANDEGVLLNVVSSLFQQQGHSLRTTAAEMNISSATVHKIARHVLYLYPYRLILKHTLSD